MNMQYFQPVRRIMVPTDFSPVSDAAIGYAIEMAAHFGARIILFHAVHYPVVAGDDLVTVANLRDMEQESDFLLEKTREKWVNASGFNSIACRTASGLAVEVIADCSRDEAIDMVVLGTHGSDGFGGWLLGTNASEISSRCNCPVLVIPENVTFRSPKRILFLTDYSDSDFQSIYLTTQYFKRFRPEIVIAHVETGSTHDDESERFDRFSKQVVTSMPYDRFKFELLSAGDVEESVDLFLSGQDCDVVVVSMRRRNFFDRLTGHSTSKKMLRHAKLPMLVFHARKPSGTPLF